jgi:hypothetical protein
MNSISALHTLFLSKVAEEFWSSNGAARSIAERVMILSFSDEWDIQSSPLRDMEGCLDIDDSQSSITFKHEYSQPLLFTHIDSTGAQPINVSASCAETRA